MGIELPSERTVLGVGIHGAGQVAAEYAAAIGANPHVRLAAVTSRRRASAERLAARFAPTATVHDRYEDLLADPGVDIVSLSVPNYLHARDAILALRAGKHVILEKPPAIAWDELHELVEAAREATTKSVVSFVLRWHPMIANLKAMLDSGAIGDVYYAEADYWHGIKPSFSSYEWIRRKEFAGGAMITGGCHAADMVRYLSGLEVAEVSAYSHRARGDFDYPTTLVAAVRFDGGAVGKLSASLDGLAYPYQFNIDLLGTDGAIRDNRVYSRGLFPEQTDWVTLPSATPNSGAVHHHPFQRVIDNLVDCILDGTPVLSDILDGARSIAVALAIEESAATGESVAVPELWRR